MAHRHQQLSAPAPESELALALVSEPWHLLASPEIVEAVDSEFSNASRNKDQHMHPGSRNRAIHHPKSNESQGVEK